jgi:hypothetical protein
LVKGLQTDVAFMDIAKAVDTVDHSILFQKLHNSVSLVLSSCGLRIIYLDVSNV